MCCLKVWIPSAPDEPLSGDLLDEWLQRGPKKLTIDDETLFVDPQVLKGVLDSKVFKISKAFELCISFFIFFELTVLIVNSFVIERSQHLLPFIDIFPFQSFSCL